MNLADGEEPSAIHRFERAIDLNIMYNGGGLRWTRDGKEESWGPSITVNGPSMWGSSAEMHTSMQDSKLAYLHRLTAVVIVEGRLILVKAGMYRTDWLHAIDLGHAGSDMVSKLIEFELEVDVEENLDLVFCMEYGEGPLTASSYSDGSAYFNYEKPDENLNHPNLKIIEFDLSFCLDYSSTNGRGGRIITLQKDSFNLLETFR